MLAILAVLLTIYARAVKECECGGTLERPILDRWFCDDLKPPGMELREPENSVNLYTVACSWSTVGRDSYVLVRIYGTGSYTFYGYILQGRIDNIPLGAFVAGNNPGTMLKCQSFARNTWYYVNFTKPIIFGQAFWFPTTDKGQVLTMHATIIRDRKTYYQLVYQLPVDPKSTTSTDATFSIWGYNTTTNTTFATATTNTRASTSITCSSSSVQSVTSNNT